MGCSIAACASQNQAQSNTVAAGETETHREHKAHSSGRFSVRHVTGAQDKPTERVGIVTRDANGKLAVEKADDGQMGSELREAIARMNTADSLPEDAQTGAKEINRGTPGFFDAQRDSMRKLYGFELIAL